MTHVVSFTIDRWNQSGKIVILKFIQHTMNKDLLLLRDFFELWKMKFMTAVSKCGYIDKLDDIVYKYNDTYHRTMWNMPMLSQVAILNLTFKLTIRKVGDDERI